MFELIKMAASDESVDPAKLHALLDAQERVLNRKREDDFNAAFDDMLKEIPRIVKKGSVSYAKGGETQEAFRFARYEDIEKIVEPIMRKHGFRIRYTMEERAGGGCIMTATLIHKAGHSESNTIPLALDTSGGKNNIQAMGSTSSYGRRYTLCMLLDIVTVGEDDDANGGVGEFITTDEAIELDLKIKSVGADRPAFMQYFAVEDIRNLPKRDLKKAQMMLKAKESKRAGA